MPLFLVEHHVVSLNPYSPKNNALKKVPNFHIFDKLLINPLPPPKKKAYYNEDYCNHWYKLTKFVHDEGGPLPISLGLNAIPKLSTGCHTSFFPFLENGEWGRGTLFLNGGGPILAEWRKLLNLLYEWRVMENGENFSENVSLQSLCALQKVHDGWQNNILTTCGRQW